MPDKTFNILRTKLYRPPLTQNLVSREHLLRRLEGGRQRSITLVSAPAGYGKTTLVSQWLEQSECPSAWLSLDAEDSDLRRFLHYGVAAIQGLFPDFGRETLALLSELDLPALGVLIPTLLNELAQLHEPWMLVLDDYHRLHDSAVHELIREGLAHPQLFLHLVIMSRYDPPLPLTRLRAGNDLTEIRESELRFSAKETQRFFRQMTGVSIDAGIAAELDEKVEGWVTGLRLATLSLRNAQDVGGFLARLPEDSRYITDYLLEEVFARQPDAVRQCLLRTAMLDRFCGSLCERLCRNSAHEAWLNDGQKFLGYLRQQGLFTVELDERHSWFRYHHLFQTFLQRRLRAQHNPQEIADLHRRAMRWFESQGLIDEALQQALAAEDLPAALELVARHRHALMNEEQWPRLASWLNLFPREVVEQTPDLLILRVWLAYRRLRVAEMAPDLDKIKTLRDKLPADASERKRLRGEYAALRTYPQYLAADGEGACASARLALKMLPDDALYARSMAVLMLSISMQIRGEFRGATELVYQALEQNAFHHTSHHTRLMAALCFVHWMEADLSGVEQIAAQHLALSQDLGLAESVQYARYFLGSCHYQRNRLTEAASYVSTAIHPGEVPTTREAFFCDLVLAFTHLAQGNPSAAHEIADRLLAAAMKEGNSVIVRYMQTFKMELTLRQGELEKAIAMMRHVTPPPLFVIPRIYLPQLTAVKVGIAQASAESLQQAASLLAELREYHERVHHLPFQIEILAVQALLEEAQGERNLALSTFTQALRLAKPGGFIRLFVDLGPGMEPLLKACGQQEQNLREYAAQLLKALEDDHIRTTDTQKDEIQQRASAVSSVQNGLIGTVTNRELDILELLAQRYRNQEIAERLCISPKTVKKHLYNLYQKLEVHGRREAVAKALELRLISQRE